MLSILAGKIGAWGLLSNIAPNIYSEQEGYKEAIFLCIETPLFQNSLKFHANLILLHEFLHFLVS